MTVSKLATVSKYSWQRGGNFGQIARKPINKLVLHHNAGTGSGVVPNCWVGRQASAHYQIENGTIISCLDEDITAWHCGASGVDNNSHTIGIEHQNSTGAPDWKVSAENQEKSAQLVAEICKRRGIPIDRNHIVRHREMPNCQTACSGGLDIDWIVNRAKEIAGEATASSSSKTKEINEEEIMKIIKLPNNATYYLVRSTGVTTLTAQEWIGVKRVLGFKDSDVDTVNQAEFDGIKSALGKK
ncbi:peptidoglycan recognition protein family protein [Lactococcus kimchii]|uniref:peptidoglycan recognition protein family protein n=1 Tax=Lactococcus sp. S-13 TaxID=2507158 RepID=UPI001023D5ED|nr:peptidoglycan recognition family protein [Lactococcus sp. S-13]RZI47978.1 N-acetylmuramoyl-L-alanine amidase [Lactococcus sp. S-13]RZI48771.1 N-acetylmuramoyl-L-alanine amidase [Lactococcus sp. S-13]